MATCIKDQDDVDQCPHCELVSYMKNLINSGMPEHLLIQMTLDALTESTDLEVRSVDSIAPNANPETRH